MRLILIFACLIAFTAIVPVVAKESPNPLQPLLKDHRILLVFSPSPNNQNYLSVRNDMAEHERAAFKRQLQVIYVFPDDVDTSPVLEQIEKSDPSYLRAAYDARPEKFSVVLVDKDRDVKLRSSEPVMAEAIFEKIDNAPMRKVEMFLPNPYADDDSTL